MKISLIHIAFIYLAIINVATFFLFGIDKWKAKRSKWRIPEATLLLMAVIGGSIGAWLGMHIWHHKTLHKKFRYGVPLILIVQVVVFFMVSCRTRQAVKLSMPIPEHKFVPEHSPDVFLITYDADIGKDPILKAVKEYKCEIVYDYSIIPGMAIKKPGDRTLEETMQLFRTVKGVKTVEYDHIIRLTDPVKPKLEIQ